MQNTLPIGHVMKKIQNNIESILFLQRFTKIWILFLLLILTYKIDYNMQSIINPAKEKRIPEALHYDFLNCSTYV